MIFSQITESSEIISDSFLTELVGMMRLHAMSSFLFEEGDLSLRIALEEIKGNEHHDFSTAMETLLEDLPSRKLTEYVAESPEMGRFSDVGQSLGGVVEKNDILGFVDVGILRMPIRSPENGHIVECYVQDGDILGFHQPVFRISSIDKVIG